MSLADFSFMNLVAFCVPPSVGLSYSLTQGEDEGSKNQVADGVTIIKSLCGSGTYKMPDVSLIFTLSL